MEFSSPDTYTQQTNTTRSQKFLSVLHELKNSKKFHIGQIKNNKKVYANGEILNSIVSSYKSDLRERDAEYFTTDFVSYVKKFHSSNNNKSEIPKLPFLDTSNRKASFISKLDLRYKFSRHEKKIKPSVPYVHNFPRTFSTPTLPSVENLKLITPQELIPAMSIYSNQDIDDSQQRLESPSLADMNDILCASKVTFDDVQEDLLIKDQDNDQSSKTSTQTTIVLSQNDRHLPSHENTSIKLELTNLREKFQVEQETNLKSLELSQKKIPERMGEETIVDRNFSEPQIFLSDPVKQYNTPKTNRLSTRSEDLGKPGILSEKIIQSTYTNRAEIKYTSIPGFPSPPSTPNLSDSTPLSMENALSFENQQVLSCVESIAYNTLSDSIEKSYKKVIVSNRSDYEASQNSDSTRSNINDFSERFSTHFESKPNYKEPCKTYSSTLNARDTLLREIRQSEDKSTLEISPSSSDLNYLYGTKDISKSNRVPSPCDIIKPSYDFGDLLLDQTSDNQHMEKNSKQYYRNDLDDSLILSISSRRIPLPSTAKNLLEDYSQDTSIKDINNYLFSEIENTQTYINDLDFKKYKSTSENLNNTKEFDSELNSKLWENSLNELQYNIAIDLDLKAGENLSVTDLSSFSEPIEGKQIDNSISDNIFQKSTSELLDIIPTNNRKILQPKSSENCSIFQDDPVHIKTFSCKEETYQTLPNSKNELIKSHTRDSSKSSLIEQSSCALDIEPHSDIELMRIKTAPHLGTKLRKTTDAVRSNVFTQYRSNTHRTFDIPLSKSAIQLENCFQNFKNIPDSSDICNNLNKESTSTNINEPQITSNLKDSCTSSTRLSNTNQVDSNQKTNEYNNEESSRKNQDSTTLENHLKSTKSYNPLDESDVSDETLILQANISTLILILNDKGINMQCLEELFPLPDDSHDILIKKWVDIQITVLEYGYGTALSKYLSNLTNFNSTKFKKEDSFIYDDYLEITPNCPVNSIMDFSDSDTSYVTCKSFRSFDSNINGITKHCNDGSSYSLNNDIFSNNSDILEDNQLTKGFPSVPYTELIKSLSSMPLQDILNNNHIANDLLLNIENHISYTDEISPLKTFEPFIPNIERVLTQRVSKKSHLDSKENYLFSTDTSTSILRSELSLEKSNNESSDEILKQSDLPTSNLHHKENNELHKIETNMLDQLRFTAFTTHSLPQQSPYISILNDSTFLGNPSEFSDKEDTFVFQSGRLITKSYSVSKKNEAFRKPSINRLFTSRKQHINSEHSKIETRFEISNNSCYVYSRDSLLSSNENTTDKYCDKLESKIKLNHNKTLTDLKANKNNITKYLKNTNLLNYPCQKNITDICLQKLETDDEIKHTSSSKNSPKFDSKLNYVLPDYVTEQSSRLTNSPRALEISSYANKLSDSKSNSLDNIVNHYKYNGNKVDNNMRNSERLRESRYLIKSNPNKTINIDKIQSLSFMNHEKEFNKINQEVSGLYNGFNLSENTDIETRKPMEAYQKSDTNYEIPVKIKDYNSSSNDDMSDNEINQRKLFFYLPYNDSQGKKTLISQDPDSQCRDYSLKNFMRYPGYAGKQRNIQNTKLNDNDLELNSSKLNQIYLDKSAYNISEKENINYQENLFTYSNQKTILSQASTQRSENISASDSTLGHYRKSNISGVIDISSGKRLPNQSSVLSIENSKLYVGSYISPIKSHPLGTYWNDTNHYSSVPSTTGTQRDDTGINKIHTNDIPCYQNFRYTENVTRDNHGLSKISSSDTNNQTKKSLQLNHDLQAGEYYTKRNYQVNSFKPPVYESSGLTSSYSNINTSANYNNSNKINSSLFKVQSERNVHFPHSARVILPSNKYEENNTVYRPKKVQPKEIGLISSSNSVIRENRSNLTTPNYIPSTTIPYNNHI